MLLFLFDLYLYIYVYICLQYNILYVDFSCFAVFFCTLDYRRRFIYSKGYRYYSYLFVVLGGVVSGDDRRGGRN